MPLVFLALKKLEEISTVQGSRICLAIFSGYSDLTYGQIMKIF